MELDDDHIKKLFSSKLTRFEPEVPDTIWSKIDTKLGAVITVSKIPLYKKFLRKNIVRLSIATSGIAAIIIAILYFMPQRSNRVSSLVTENKGKVIKLLLDDLNKQLAYNSLTHSNTINIDLSNDNNYVTGSKKQILNNIYIPTSNFADSTLTKLNDSPRKTVLATNITYSNNHTSHNDITIASVANMNQLDDEIAAKIATFKEDGDNQKKLLALNNNDYIENKKNIQKLGIGLNGGSSVSSSDQFNRDFKPPYSNGYPSVSLRSTKTRMKHNQPITFGITISKQISSKLSIESGITYAYLSSKLGAGDTDDFRKKDMQYFHYLGIPLTLNYSFARWNKFIFYSSLGGMVQKDLWGRRTTHTYLGTSDSEYSTKEKISQRNPQFSIHGGLGTSYPIYDKLRIYTKLGAAYYIGANNQYETIYSDKKWLFNFNLGLKFEF